MKATEINRNGMVPSIDDEMRFKSEEQIGRQYFTLPRGIFSLREVTFIGTLTRPGRMSLLRGFLLEESAHRGVLL